jgi:hypothetical protein
MERAPRIKPPLFKKWAAAAIALPLWVVSGGVNAGEMANIPVQKDTAASEAQSRWRISMGVMVRRIQSEFAIDPRASDFGFAHGGSRRLFGGDLNEQAYADGRVFLGGIPADIARQQGIAAFSGGQVSHLRPLSGGQLVAPGTLLGTVTFHSTEIAGQGLENAGDSNLAAAPYVKGEYVLHQTREGELSLFGQYAYVADSDHSSGNVQGGLHGTSFQFRYDAAFVQSPGLAPGNVFYNANAANAFNPQFSPKPTNPSVTRSSLTVRSRASLEEGLHEITLGIGYTRRLWDRVHLSLAIGPTFNLFDYDFESRSDLRVGGATVATSRQSQDSQAFRLGVMEQAGLVVDLDRQGRWFLEVFGRYNWVDTFKAGTNQSNVKVDASSFSGGIGLGVRL